MVDIVQPKFGLGQVVATPGALELLQFNGQSPQVLIDRHVRGDWGDLSQEDCENNEAALSDGTRILSAYVTRNRQRIWIITEAADDRGQRSSTTILLPQEY